MLLVNKGAVNDNRDSFLVFLIYCIHVLPPLSVIRLLLTMPPPMPSISAVITSAHKVKTFVELTCFPYQLCHASCLIRIKVMRQFDSLQTESWPLQSHWNPRCIGIITPITHAATEKWYFNMKDYIPYLVTTEIVILNYTQIFQHLRIKYTVFVATLNVIKKNVDLSLNEMSLMFLMDPFYNSCSQVCYMCHLAYVFDKNTTYTKLTCLLSISKGGGQERCCIFSNDCLDGRLFKKP